MELQRGVCDLCANNKILPQSNADLFKDFLPEILNTVVTRDETVRDSIKMCMLCSFHIQKAREIRTQIGDFNAREAQTDRCRFCNSEENVYLAKSDWKFLLVRIEGYVKATDFPIQICHKCVFFFDVAHNVRTKLHLKFPKIFRKETETHRRKSNLKSPVSSKKRLSSILSQSHLNNSKKRRMFQDCFAYLQPLCNNNYQLSETLKQDTLLYNKIAYVNVLAKDQKETPKERPIIKIKLKPKGVKDVYLTYVKASKSEEHPSKLMKGNPRRYSDLDQKENTDAPLEFEETPKASSKQVPNRRVSTLLMMGADEEQSELVNGLSAENGDDPDGDKDIGEFKGFPSPVGSSPKHSDSDSDKVKLDESLNGSERKKKRVTFSDEIVL